MTETATNGHVTLTIEDRLAHVQLNRPEKLNSLTRDVFDDLVELGQRLKADPDVACVVITGAGRAFCAGLDLSAFDEMKSENETPPWLLAIASAPPALSARKPSMYGPSLRFSHRWR